MDLKDPDLISRYVNQFGVIRANGKRYLKEALFFVAQQDFQCSCEWAIAKVAEKHGVKTSSIKESIRRFVKKSLAEGFSWEWKRFAGWDKTVAPSPTETVRILSKQYPPFVKTYEEILKTNFDWYIRPAVEAADLKKELR